MNEPASAVEALAGQGEQAPPAATQESGNAPWYGEIEGDLKGWVENKGWKSAHDALNSAWNLEKMFGADKAGNTVVMPKEGDAEGWNSLYNRLGRPETPEEYKFKLPEGVDPSNLNGFKEIAHRHGLTQSQFENVITEYDKMVDENQERSQNEYKQKQAEQLAELKKEWGLAYDQNLNLANRAAAKFGFTEEEMQSMQDSIGSKSMLQKLSAIGKAFGEDSFISGENTSEFVLSPAAAQAQISDLNMDKNFMEAYFSNEHPGHQAAVDKMSKLMKAAHPR